MAGSGVCLCLAPKPLLTLVRPKDVLVMHLEESNTAFSDHVAEKQKGQEVSMAEEHSTWQVCAGNRSLGIFFSLPDALDVPCVTYSFFPYACQVQPGAKCSPSKTHALPQLRPSSVRAAGHRKGQSMV